VRAAQVAATEMAPRTGAGAAGDLMARMRVRAD